MLDLDYAEDSACETDMNVVMTGGGGFVEVQGTAEGATFSRRELDALLGLAERGIGELIASSRERRLTSPELVDYYRRRASEYEAIYAKPERQGDLARLRDRIPGLLRGARVLEIACGTGYWTQLVAGVAAAVVATDLAEEPMRIAQSKSYVQRPVFSLADAYALPESLGRFDAALAVFWWSHVPGASASANSSLRCTAGSSPARGSS